MIKIMSSPNRGVSNPLSLQNRQEHQQEVLSFLQSHFPGRSWDFTLPKGTGHETYFAHTAERAFFVKVGAQADRYRAVASLGLAPPVLAYGSLPDGTSILVQPCIPGKNPSRRDYRERLEQFASAIRKVHHSPAVKQVLPEVPFDLYSSAGLEALGCLQQKWERYRSQVPALAGFVDESLADLRQQVMAFQGSGLVASHNDICNANWLISSDGQLYLIDLDSMALDDPALDIGATLWWYYPPGLRNGFLAVAGYSNDDSFMQRMQVRMAMHCLNILLPRPGSFDEFEPDSFAGSLTDFRAILAGQENPQGYDD
jgi:hypothetical protein